MPLKRAWKDILETKSDRYEASLVNGKNNGNTTKFYINHQLNTEFPKRLVAKKTGDKSEVHPFVKIISANELEITFSPKVRDNNYYVVIWT